MKRISKRGGSGDEFDRREAKSAVTLAFPWAAGEVAWYRAWRPGRGGSRGGGTCARRVGAARRFGEGFVAAVGLAGKRNRGGELRGGMARGYQARQRQFREWRHLRSMHGGGEAVRGGVPSGGRAH